MNIDNDRFILFPKTPLDTVYIDLKDGHMTDIGIVVVFEIGCEALYYMVLLPGLEPGTSSLPMKCSTTEL